MHVIAEEGRLDLLLEIPSLEDHTRQEEQKRRVGQSIGQGEGHVSHAEVEMMNDVSFEIESFEVRKRIVNGIDDHLADFVQFFGEFLEVTGQVPDHINGKGKNGAQRGTRKRREENGDSSDDHQFQKY